MITNSSFIVDSNQVEQIDGMTYDYPYVMHERNLTDIVIPWHWHEEVELGYIQTGTGKIMTTEQEFTVHQGDGFFINSNVMDMKQNAVRGKKALEINHIFHPTLLAGHFKSIYDTKYIAPITANRSITVHVIRRGHKTSDELLSVLQRLYELNRLEHMEFQTRNLLSEAWLLLIEDLRTHYTAFPVKYSEGQERLKTMLAFIHQNYGDKITAGQIAATVHVSEREAARIFQKTLHMSPTEYLIAYRLNEAARLLVGTDESVTSVSFRTGFSDSAYFGKLFKQKYGMTPTEYRGSVFSGN